MSDVTATTSAVDTSAAQGAPQPQEGSKGEASPQQVAAMKEKFKFVVDGEEVEEEIDFSNKEDLKNRLQLARAAKKRMTEAAEAKKKAAEILSKLDNDPSEILKRLGPKGREIAEQYLLSQIQDEMLSPEEKERRQEKSELEKLRKEIADRKKAEEEAILKTRENEYAQSFQKTIIEAIEGSGLPKTPEMVKRMAGIMKKNLEYGLELTPQDLIQEVKKDIVSLIRSIVKDSEASHLESLFGEDITKKLRKYDIERLKSQQASGFQKPKTERTEPSSSSSRKPQTLDEWKASLDQKYK